MKHWRDDAAGSCGWRRGGWCNKFSRTFTGEGYARCFASGFRRSLEHTLLDTAPEHIKKTHTYFIEIRNKHVAHSVNSSEKGNVLVANLNKIGVCFLDM